jgi:hypothetical protein
MNMSKWTLSIVVTAAAGCSGAGLHTRPLANGGAYLRANRIVWLTPHQRSYMSCRDGQPLVCAASGRSSLAQCQCLMSLGGNSTRGPRASTR